MATVKISIVQKNPSIIFKKKNDLWIWFFAILFCVCGIALSVLFSILLRISYQDGNTPLPAYSGAIVAGFALSLAGLTQILVFIHRKEDEKRKRLSKTEHDYTNFFIKNYPINEMVYMVLSSVNESLGISISFDADHNAIINYTGTQSFTAVRQQYVTLLVTEILTNAVFINLLNKKNNNIIARPLGPNTSGNVFSVFDTEIKTSAMSIEKILQSATNLDYEEEYYSFNMKDRISKIAKEILVYYLVIVHDNHQFVFAADVVDQIPFVLYDISRGGK